MAPERIIGQEYTIYSDIWSFGLSLCELALGEFPYKQLSLKMSGSHSVLPMELMQCIVDEPPPRLSPTLFSQQLVDFISCCLQKEAGRRLLPQQLLTHKLVTETMSKGWDANAKLVANWLKSTTVLQQNTDSPDKKDIIDEYPS